MYGHGYHALSYPQTQDKSRHFGYGAGKGHQYGSAKGHIIGGTVIGLPTIIGAVILYSFWKKDQEKKQAESTLNALSNPRKRRRKNKRKKTRSRRKKR